MSKSLTCIVYGIAITNNQPTQRSNLRRLRPGVLAEERPDEAQGLRPPEAAAARVRRVRGRLRGQGKARETRQGRRTAFEERLK